MTLTAVDILAVADEALSEARTVLNAGVTRQAARLAYQAQFHAAQAFIFERTGKIAKTHKGVNVQFHKLATAEPSIEPQLAGTLSTAYHYKEIVDYELGVRRPIPTEEASMALATAEHFVAEIKRVLASSPTTTPTT